MSGFTTPWHEGQRGTFCCITSSWNSATDIHGRCQELNVHASDNEGVVEITKKSLQAARNCRTTGVWGFRKRITSLRIRLYHPEVVFPSNTLACVPSSSTQQDQSPKKIQPNTTVESPTKAKTTEYWYNSTSNKQLPQTEKHKKYKYQERWHTRSQGRLWG